jgi:prepilin-type processing-associated H-X9-DG protein
MNANANKRRWFSKPKIIVIVCLLLVGVVIAILTGHNVFEAAHRFEAMTNLLQIEKAYDFYISTSNPVHAATQPGDTAHDFVVSFARITKQNDASVWFIKSDEKLAGEEIPKMVILGDLKTGQINPAFAKLPLSYEMVGNLALNSPPTTTPIVWTRGLRDDGTWAPDSPWQGKGGHIAYLDGHVEWADKFSSVKYGTHTPTTDIREALPPGAVILSAEPAQTGR